MNKLRNNFPLVQSISISGLIITLEITNRTSCYTLNGPQAFEHLRIA